MNAPDAFHRLRTLVTTGLAGWLLLAPVAAFAEGSPAAVALGPGSALWLEGTSSVHDFESRTSTLGLVLMREPAQADPVDAAALRQWLQGGGLRGLELTVPLQAMRSGKSGLDKNMLKALRATEFPEIRFDMTSARLGTARGDTLLVTADGTLKVAGRERAITVTGQLVSAEQGAWLEGTHPLKMTEYGVKPPTMMMGAIKTHDPVVVKFKLLLVPGKGNTQ